MTKAPQVVALVVVLLCAGAAAAPSLLLFMDRLTAVPAANAGEVADLIATTDPHHDSRRYVDPDGLKLPVAARSVNVKRKTSGYTDIPDAVLSGLSGHVEPGRDAMDNTSSPLFASYTSWVLNSDFSDLTEPHAGRYSGSTLI